MARAKATIESTLKKRAIGKAKHERIPIELVVDACLRYGLDHHPLYGEPGKAHVGKIEDAIREAMARPQVQVSEKGAAYRAGQPEEA